MFLAPSLRPAHRLLLAGYLVLALLVVQGLRVHVHTFADHGPLHGHEHAIELHVVGIPTDSGHDDPENETAPAGLALLKIKQTNGVDAVALFAIVVLTIVLSGDAPGRALAHTPPVVRGDRRSPPLRAPPR